MTLDPVYKSLVVEKEKKAFLKGYHLDFDGLHLFMNVAIEGYEFDAEPQNMVQNFLEILQKHITEENELSMYDRFEEGLKEVNFFLNDLKEKKESGQVGRIDSVIGLLDQNSLYLTKTGLAESYLLRKGNVIEISEGLYSGKNNDANHFVNIASGDLEVGDKVIFCSKRLLKFVGKADLTNVFLTHDLEISFRDLEQLLTVEDTGDVLVNGFTGALSASQLSSADEETLPASARTSARSLSPEKVLDLSKQAFDKSKDITKKVVAGMRDPRQRRNYLVVGAILIVALILLNTTVFSGGGQKDQNIKKYEELLQTARDRLTDARQQRLYDAKLSKTSLETAKKSVLDVRNAGVLISDADRILQEIQQEEEKLDRIINLTNPLVFVDLSKKEANFSAAHLVNFNNAFYIITPTSVWGPIVDTSPESFSKGPSLENNETFLAADKFTDRNSLVFFSSGNKVIEYKDNNLTFMDTEDTVWKTAVDIRTYASRQFVYLLDPLNNNIWRYERTTQKYRKPTAYNTDNVDIKDAVSFAIDGGIYILKANGEVKRLLSQKNAPFSIEGGPSVPLKNLDSRAKIYTNENLRNIYIMDPANQRLLVYKKVTFDKPEKMTYDRQFVLKTSEMRDFWVDDTEQNLYILTPQQLLKIDMRSLAP